MSVHVLLVGIDDYGDSAPRLHGCLRDIKAAAEYFEHHVPKDDLHQLCLVDGEATRAAVIDGFRDHLGRAWAGDTALFWFSGHGSQAPVPPELAATEPTGVMQTLVCADSRRDGVPDLCDKEVAVLIGEIVARGAHVVTVFDSCHSDGADREAGAGAGANEFGDQDVARLSVRWAPATDVPPSMSALLAELGMPTPTPMPMPTPASAPTSVLGGGARSAIGLGASPNYVALAACRRNQTAQEIQLADGRRGVFSLAVLKQLEGLGPSPTYRELMTGVRCYVENLVSHQTPVLFPIAEPVVDRAFLGGAARLPRSSMTMRCLRGVWEIDAGACHGIVAGPADDRTRVGVPGAGGDGADWSEAEVVQVWATKSLVRPLAGWRPDPGRQFQVVVTAVPQPPASVAVSAAPDADETARLLINALNAAGPGGGSSPYVRLAAFGTDAFDRTPDVVLSVPKPNVARILGAGGGELVNGAYVVTDAMSAAGVVADVEHIARWRGVKALENPSSRIAGAIRIEVSTVDPAGPRTDGASHGPLRTDQTGCIALEYAWDGSQWVPPEVFIALRNTSERQLYCVLLDMTDRFQSQLSLFPGDLVAPLHTAWAAEGSPIAFSLPPGADVVPGAEVADWLKVIVAEEPFNAAPFVLPRLGEPAPGRRDLAAGRLPAADWTTADWTTAVLPVVTRVPDTVE
ncbi:caspase family protein [Catenulispora rubra]|uniref:caspase family protein n=1 Tax=Catenulispora rubra TaxID=280293 RepID=UPI0018923D2C|nr:caspase family protein [Catenulispora rubra]